MRGSSDLEAIEKLRKEGKAPRFVAPAGVEPPDFLKSPPPPRRQVGRKVYGGEGVITNGEMRRF